MKQLEDRCHAVLQSADILLARYPRIRRRPGDSLAGRILYPCLPMLQGLQAMLTSEECKKLQIMKEALWERLDLLRKRRIPLCPQLQRFRARCREMLLALPKIPEVWDSPSVLVGTLRSPHQLDICLEYGFYHVPDRQVPADWLPIDYVAIYQSRTMFQEEAGILVYGPVKSCTAVRRREIREIPKHSDGLYYRLDIEHWEQLESPIIVREIPIRHLMTNLFLLTHCQETPELTLKTPENYIFYQALKYARKLGNGTVFRHRRGSVRIKNGLFQVYRHGLKIAAFRVEDFTETPALIFRELMDVLEKKP